MSWKVGSPPLLFINPCLCVSIRGDWEWHRSLRFIQPVTGDGCTGTVVGGWLRNWKRTHKIPSELGLNGDLK